MSYGSRPYGGRTWAGLGDSVASGGGVTVDPANPGATGYTWATQTGPAPWSGAAYGGGGQIARATSGGLTAYPDPDTGVVNLAAWWTEATYLRIVRVVNNVRTPVRNGYPLTVGGPTRHNYVTNPSFEVDTSGWLAGANTALTQRTDSALHGAASARLTATAAGAVTVTVPVALPIPEGSMGVSLALLLSAAPSGALTLTASWLNSSGAAAGTSVATVSAAALAAYVGRWDRTPVLPIAPPSTAASGTLTLSVAGLPAGGYLGLDGALIEALAAAGGDYFDGDSPHAGWTGPAGGSTSSLAVVTTLVDGEAPLDVNYSYELLAPSQPTLLIRSDRVRLSSRRSGTVSARQSWLTHPSTPGSPVPVKVTAAPELTRATRRGLFTVLGRPEPIAVATSVRAAEEGSLTVLTETLPERDRLVGMLADGQPLLLRAPADLGFGVGWWISVGDTVEKTQTHYAGPDLLGGAVRLHELPFSVVSAPSSATAAA